MKEKNFDALESKLATIESKIDKLAELLKKDIEVEKMGLTWGDIETPESEVARNAR